MSIQERACQMIYHLPEEKVEAVVHMLIALMPDDSEKQPLDLIDRKKEAYRKLMTLREEFSRTDIEVSEAVRDEALGSKFGVIVG